MHAAQNGSTRRMRLERALDFLNNRFKRTGFLAIMQGHGIAMHYTGSISKCGDDMMRVMLYEAAQILLMRSKQWSRLKAWAMQIARRRGVKKAVVALARRLAVVMHRIWVDGTTFRWIREETAAA